MATVKFPRTALAWSRVEHTSLPLQVLEGTVPDDLHGSYYFMAPAAHPGMGDQGSSATWPTRGSVINGDGMVYRLDLDARPQLELSSKLIRTLDFYADEASATNKELEAFRFGDLGMMRASMLLGARNFANTALLPIGPFDAGGRLLACYDAGAPVEIDPVTLDTLDPLGARADWRPEALGFLPFPPVLSTAHPFYDATDDSLWVVNYGRGLRSMLAGDRASAPSLWSRVLRPAITWLAKRIEADIEGDVEWLARVLRRTLLGYSNARPHRSAPASAAPSAPAPPSGGENSPPESMIPSDFVRLLRFRGDASPAALELVDSQGQPVAIEQSLHQIAATRHWVILMDTCFDLRIEQFYADPLPDHPEIERLLRALTAKQQLDESPLWLVERAAFESAVAAGEGRVSAVRARLPLGSVHFLADYDDTDDRLTLHVAHGVALDIAEWIRAFDQLRYVDDAAAAQELQGMISSEVDNSRIGRWVVDARSGAVLSSSLVSSQDTWGIALYAGEQLPCWGAPLERIEQVYWFTSGLWPELMSDFIWNLYADIPDREVELSSIDAMLKQGGVPSALLRVDTDPLAIVDVFRFPSGTTPSSPQFVPARVAEPSSNQASGRNNTGSTGYVFVTVWTAERAEIWVFRADALAQGPIARLGEPSLHFGFSMHACWLPRPTATLRKASPAGEILSEFKAKDPRVAEFLDKYVYPERR